jgi:hypothetical protein
MELIRGRERDCRQEIRCEVERGGARTACVPDPLGKAVGAIADEGAHPFEWAVMLSLTRLGEGITAGYDRPAL